MESQSVMASGVEYTMERENSITFGCGRHRERPENAAFGHRKTRETQHLDGSAVESPSIMASSVEYTMERGNNITFGCDCGRRSKSGRIIMFDAGNVVKKQSADRIRKALHEIWKNRRRKVH